MIPHSEWKWYGYAGHLCVGSRCAYHLSTRIGKYLVSTVGHYLPNPKTGVMETIGSGEAYFETQVFNCGGEEETGDPIILSYDTVDGKRYAKSIDAERGHYEFCQKYAEAQ
ncbi:MAG: hypothetical protein KAY22_22860 [Rhizorhabdus sp.]|uniref:hypothetical protein n=1 Tax=Rhizorhabdus sp. TaxID=1968843 RepID=UPI001B66A378|nr:hypothetical protein [Rhizorhabdus sp.]MBP8235143.1 hypothetical protein [Rhizorhabdus sp.]